MDLTILMNAGPWLAVPPAGYGGIEHVVATLTDALRARGHRVILASVAESSLEVDGLVSVFAEGQFRHLAAPYATVVGIAHAHMQAVVDEVRRNPDIDLVHDHLEVVGPATLAALGPDTPPVLQTLHWDLGKHPDFYRRFDGRGRVWFAAVSAAQAARAHPNLAAQAVDVVPLATPLPSASALRPPGDHLLTLGRFTPFKGYDLAAAICRREQLPLVMAGPVGGLPCAAALDRALADPDSPVRGYPDVAWFTERVRPLIDGRVVRWVGSVGGEEKTALLASARAVLFPLRWEEPGATAVVEAMAAGVPVVAMRRGVLPTLVDHGVTGFLADDDDEFAHYVGRVDELDRRACRQVAETRFSPDVMAARYEDAYAEVLRRSVKR